jgi:tetratricopeptide (TPR) repeat protein
MNRERLEQLRKLQAENPEDSFVAFAIAKEYESLGDEPQALYYYEELARRDPDYVGVYYHLGKLHEKLGSPAESLRVYRQGMDAARRLNDFHAYRELAAARSQLADEEESE